MTAFYDLGYAKLYNMFFAMLVFSNKKLKGVKEYDHVKR